MTAYEQGFLSKCAEYGVDGGELLRFVKSAATASFRQGMSTPRGGQASFRQGMSMQRGGQASFRQGMSGVKPRQISPSMRSFKGYNGNNTSFQGYKGKQTSFQGYRGNNSSFAGSGGSSTSFKSRTRV